MNIRARGEGFFAAIETKPYDSPGTILGQIHPDSCVAACCRMALSDEGLQIGEAFIRAALISDEQGSLLSSVPSALLQFGLTGDYIYQANLTVAELQNYVLNKPAVVFLKMPKMMAGHAVIVDRMDGEWVFIRDPWPLASGSAYCVSLADFESAWLINDWKTGRAVVGNEET